jgi:hypothetical protein
MARLGLVQATGKSYQETNQVAASEEGLDRFLQRRCLAISASKRFARRFPPRTDTPVPDILTSPHPWPPYIDA